MKLHVNWYKPFGLRLCRQSEDLIYACDKLDNIPSKPGIYVFARRYSKNIIPLYIGQASDLNSRIKQQLNNVQLMKGLQNMESGHRIILIAEWMPHSGQKIKKALNILETAFIEHSMAEGYELLNLMGTKYIIDTIISEGEKIFIDPFPRIMNIKKKA